MTPVSGEGGVLYQADAEGEYRRVGVRVVKGWRGRGCGRA